MSSPIDDIIRNVQGKDMLHRAVDAMPDDAEAILIAYKPGKLALTCYRVPDTAHIVYGLESLIHIIMHDALMPTNTTEKWDTPPPAAT